jgi:hypothetical protein
MRELLDKYNELTQREREQSDYIESRIQLRKKQIERLEKRLKGLPDTGWIKGFLEPLAAAISEKVGLPWEIYGPFGLSCNTTIYLREDMNKSICDQRTLSITIEPELDDGAWSFVYRTGETTGDYKLNTIGWLNGFYCVTEPLPDTLDEIVGLLKSSGKDWKGEEIA